MITISRSRGARDGAKAEVSQIGAPRAAKFEERGAPLLSSGNAVTPLGVAENLWLHLKAYATGGENGLHSHADEDHAFIMLGVRRLSRTAREMRSGCSGSKECYFPGGRPLPLSELRHDQPGHSARRRSDDRGNPRGHRRQSYSRVPDWADEGQPCRITTSASLVGFGECERSR
jgi:hypothetical protein